MNSSSRFKVILAGFAFAVLWASASTATKHSLNFVQPYTLSIFRFFLAALIMLFIAHVVLKKKLPEKRYWKQLMIYGLLNIAIYLGLFVIGMQYVSAGIASLCIATNPIFITIMSVVWLRHTPKLATMFSLLISSAGIIVAAYPLFETSYVTPLGLLITLASMISYSLASVYFAHKSWAGLHILTINGWQTFFGGLFTLPFFLIFYNDDKNVFNVSLIATVFWLVVPVSIGASLLWMYLLKHNPVKASSWLFLCPIFGIIIAAIILGEPVSLYTFAGVALVLAGLYLVQRSRDRATRPDA